jgi:DNA-directed RNA polymerase subunit RPC12/RpoP
MKLRCPRCEKKLSVADKYAGRAIRCPACNRGFTVPKLEQAMGPASEVDLAGLAALEMGTQQLSDEDREALEAQAIAGEKLEPGVRVCPSCGAKTKSADTTIEILCSHCWKSIPAMESESGLGGKKIKKHKEIGAFGRGGFYSEIGNAVTYPLSALSSIMTAALVAFLAGVLPVVFLTGASNVMSFSNVGTAQENDKVDLGMVPTILTLVFTAEIIFFAAVAIHAFFDIVRSTGIGEDAAPKLTWSPGNLSKSVVSYLTLLIYIGVSVFVVGKLTLDFNVTDELLAGNLEGFITGGNAFLVGVVIVASLVPMQLIGMSLGNVGQAMNVVNVAKSIGRTHVHYIFLVLLLTVFGSLFAGGFAALLFSWFIPKVSVMIAGSKEGQLAQVALALLAWGVVMACFFYGSYILARMHGLFVRSFRKKLLFGTS